MRSQIILPVLCLLLVVSAQDWEKPIVIEESEHKIAFQRMYMDQSTGTKHFVYGLESTRYRVTLLYRRLFSNGTLSPAVPLMEELRQYKSCDLTGADDGRHVYVSVCVKRPESDYYDVYFLESVNAGESFSVPVAVPRANMSDAINRYSPNIRFNEDKERLWIAYFSRDEKDLVNISYVSRSKGSLIFNPEQFAVYNVSPMNQLRFELTNAKSGKQMLYLGYLHVERDFFWPRVFYSANNGLTWNHTDGHVHYINLLDDEAQLDIAAHDEAPNFYYSANTYRSNEGYETQYFRYYPVAQGRWEAVPNNYELNKLAMCKVGGVVHIFGYSAVAAPVSGTNVTGHLVVMKYKELEDWKELVPPFSKRQGWAFEYVTLPDISCTGQTKARVAASSVGVTGEGKNLLLFTQALFDPYFASYADDTQLDEL